MDIYLFLLGDTNSATSATGRLCVLTTDTQAPVVAQTAVSADLLQTLEILAQLVVQLVGQHLSEAAVLDVLLPVEEPVGDLVLAGVGHHGDDALNLLLGQLASPLGDVNVGLLADHVTEAAPYTLDGCDGEHNLAPSINVGVEHTQNVLELFRNYQTH